ncbi:hypothetical protein [Herbaspirillum rubrisubalbicans]|uniref:hypothetical protein n=1 Tax=Herbaspirillum rubrisubalbicans TaxID=80842 RepID=UPI0012F6ED65|nr:hypothetical protein [Herbaspirillum rubrisubalbicans]
MIHSVFCLSVCALPSGSNANADADDRPCNGYDQGVTSVRESRQPGPKLKDYLEYLQYLRDHGRFWRLEKSASRAQQ